MVAERQQEVVIPIMPRLEQRPFLLHQILEALYGFRRCFQRAVAIGCKMQIVG